MSSPWVMYVYLFVIIPLLFFVGISILVKKEEFRLFPFYSILLFSLVVMIHAGTIVHFTKCMIKGEKIPIQAPIGVFTLVLAVSLLCLHIYLLRQYYVNV